MKEKVDDFFSVINKRLTNPLIISFLISWLAWNWQIVIVLLMYDLKSLADLGFKSYAHFISQQSPWRTYWLPLIFAGIYTVFAPIMNVLIKGFNAKIKVIGDNWHKRILKDASVPMDRYLKERAAQLDKEAELDRLISSESELDVENKSLKLDLVKLQDNILTCNNTIQQIEHLNNLMPFMGEWIITWFKIDGTIDISMHIIIAGNEVAQIYTVKKDKRPVSQINYNCVNTQMRFVSFVLIGKSTHRNHKLYNVAHSLNYNQAQDEMEGIQNGSVRIKYSRLSKVDSYKEINLEYEEKPPFTNI